MNSNTLSKIIKGMRDRAAIEWKSESDLLDFAFQLEKAATEPVSLPIKIGAAGEQLPTDATNHIAVLLPEHGLMFSARVINHDEASQLQLEKDCAALTLAGFSDWRLPTVDELQLVIDRSRYNPAMNTDFFVDIPLDWLWTSTDYAPSKNAAGVASAAWCVSASLGLVGSNRRDYDDGFALAVRSAGQ